MTEGMQVIGYVRVSTDEQGVSGIGLEAQRRAIRVECKNRGWKLLRIEEDVASGKSTNGRPGLERALAGCAAGEAQGLVAAKLDRITRSLLDFAKLVQEAQRRGYDLVVIEQGFDLSTSHGRAMAGMLAVFAEFERELISDRITAALAIVKKRTPKQLRQLSEERGVEVKAIGRPRTLPANVRQRIRARGVVRGRTQLGLPPDSG